MFLLKGPRWSDDVHNAADAVGHTESKVKTAKRKLLVQTKRDGKIGAWYMYLPDHEGQVPEGRPREKHEDQEEQEDNQEEQEVNADTVSRPIDFLTSCPLAQDQEVISTSQEGKRMNGEVRGEDDFLPSGEPTPDEVSPVAETTKPGNVGNGKEHVFDFEAFKARVLDGHNESRAKRLEAEQ